MGHGIQLASTYTARLFLLTPVCYVDDTDLLHFAPSVNTTDRELFVQVHAATTAWGHLAQASGGAPKPEKCYIYILSCRFINGKARLKEPKHLLKEPITIPQPTGPQVPIKVLGPTDNEEMLGVFYNSSGDRVVHIEQMREKGANWVDRL